TRARKSTLVGTGPYRVEAATDALVRLERSTSYWGPAPALERIVFVREPDDARALSLARGGELDLIPALGPVHRPLMEEPGMVRRFQAATAAAPVFEYLVLLADSPPFNDVRVRRAVSLAIDRKAMAADDRSSLARPIAAPVWPGGPAGGPAPGVPAPGVGRLARPERRWHPRARRSSLAGRHHGERRGRADPRAGHRRHARARLLRRRAGGEPGGPAQPDGRRSLRPWLHDLARSGRRRS